MRDGHIRYNGLDILGKFSSCLFIGVSFFFFFWQTFNLRQILLKIKQEIKWKRPSAWIAARPQSVRNDGQEREK